MASFGFNKGGTQFVLNRKNFREQILKGKGTADFLAALLGEGAYTESSVDGNRVRARVKGSMAEEAKSGTLSRRLGGI